MALLACVSCGRHIREATCPFCGVLNIRAGAAARATATPPTRGLTRAAFVLGAAMGLSGCTDRGADSDAGTDSAVGPDAAYGGPPIDAATDDARGDSGPLRTDAGRDSGPVAQDAGGDTGLVAAYGGPPIGRDAGPGRDAGSGPVPAYGIPPMPDEE